MLPAIQFWNDWFARKIKASVLQLPILSLKGCDCDHARAPRKDASVGLSMFDSYMGGTPTRARLSCLCLPANTHMHTDHGCMSHCCTESLTRSHQHPKVCAPCHLSLCYNALVCLPYQASHPQILTRDTRQLKCLFTYHKTWTMV